MNLYVRLIACLILAPSPIHADEPDPANSKAAVEALATGDASKHSTTPLTKDDTSKALAILLDRRVSEVRAAREAEVKTVGSSLASWRCRSPIKSSARSPRGAGACSSPCTAAGMPLRGSTTGSMRTRRGCTRPRRGLSRPEGATNTWDLWHQSHIDGFFERLIEDMVVFEGVDRDRVYLMGYSAGGDGVYQVAPRMADRFAAASMMAGHPNESSPLGLRNLPFALHVGANDSAYNRNKVAREYGDKLDELRKADPLGYTHLVEIHPDRGHWMNKEDASAVPWMAGFRRDPTPKKVVWHQDDVTHDRFYWLAIPPGQAKAGTTVVASVDGQEVRIEKLEGVETLIVRLDDRLLDLDKPVKVTFGDKTLFEGVAPRTIANLQKTLQGPGDPKLAFAAEVAVTTGK